MSAEVYFFPLKEAPPVTLGGLAERFADAGMPCAVEPQADEMHCLVFTESQSTVLVSLVNDEVALATLYYSYVEDDISVGQRIEKVLQSAGLSADEDAEYK